MVEAAEPDMTVRLEDFNARRLAELAELCGGDPVPLDQAKAALAQLPDSARNHRADVTDHHRAQADAQRAIWRSTAERYGYAL
ncbi:MAG: hypothetical protein KC776_28840 [Myxococcales bacterium]|nr:hypothetical protein [Myxococcales bacterium]MCB9580967.1 hypothetical protein [Polyangiaceae bacterium]